ncbi:LysR family transcriptional regulator [Aerophototrophica crusticola]|uniref:LysR family transcriptional regulator n=1 Tax=Aerophototrophica crusticola TaxID=1709002 RepID=A0A858R7E1_9PROT|nr:LysR family transcriptional regulator [Rhodospirillaceae bacterium B3]
MDRLDDLKLFTLVAETKSFTKAADKLGLSKSAASRRVAELEARLGTRLFHRTTRSISLTQVGQGFCQRVSQILAELEEAERSVTSEHAAPRGTLKVAAPMSFGLSHLAPVLCGYMERYPEVQVDMDVSDRFVDLVEEGYDVAVRIGRLKDSSLVARRICPIRMVVCASPAYLARRGTPQTPAELVEHDCLLYTNSQSFDQWSFRIAPGSAETQGVRVQGRMRVSNGDVLRQAALAGLGIVVLPSFIVGDDLLSGKLRGILTEYTVSEGALHAVYPANRHLSPKVRAFVDLLATSFGPVPYWDAGLVVLKGG